MKNVTLRRFGAYLIDLLIIGIIGAILSYIPMLNPNANEYEQTYQEVLSLYERYSNNEITLNEYETGYISLSYDLNRSNAVYTCFNLVLLLLYFVIVPVVMKGQTVGKKLLRLKVVSHQDEGNVGIVSYLVRAIIQNNILITVAQLGIIFYFTKDNYYTIYNNVNMVGYILLYLIVFLVLVRKDKRGLHDLVAGTKVISLEDYLIDHEETPKEVLAEEVKEEKKSTSKKKKIEEVQDANFEEVKKPKTKKKSTKSKK